MSGIVIRNGQVVTALDQYVADIYCDGGKIVAIGERLDVPAGTEVVDASGQYVFPGGIDAHTHMELPFMGTVSSDDFFTGTAAGVAGGTTTIIDFIIPSRNQSLIEARDFWMNNAKKACADYGFHMAVTWYGEQVEQEMRRVHREDGISSFKVFMAYTGAIGVDDDEMIGVIDTAADLGALVTAHCEHGLAVQALQRKLVAQGKTAPRYHAESRPSWVEGEATNRAIMLAKCSGQPIYIVHLTCKESLDAVVRARQEGQLVYVETCPQYLLLDDSVYDKPDFEGAAYVMSPPIRPRGHQDALWHALSCGLIHHVATDHCPFRQHDQKVMGLHDFTRIPNGAAGIENRMALMYTYGVAAGRLTLQQLVDVCCTQPAKIFGLYPRKGAIRVGSDADLFVYDPAARSTISASTHRQRVDRNIFEGFEIRGAVTSTVVAGKLAFTNGDLRVERGAGRYLHRT
ncbi:dihydropyrimidinase [Nannocystis sp. SCPEA4]|uniref:dihydropyrimidinase n=1 Tax=Nannocystis sp. SCPEA4 TaxID=2996787 RepID=UPI00226F4B4B|nr:dihydropyrimidinase [Nannocystis sp. SCPEA4]MCY1054969.1 dihydropyrimidinase [Nannocystis sp. SCPEA4]